MLSLGISRRLRRLQGPAGRVFLFAADHGLPAGPLPGLEDPRELLGSLAGSRGFLYVVARYGTTGMRADLPQDLRTRLAALHKATSLPLAVGFGVSTPEHVRALASSGADGIVVGSAIVQKAAERPDPGALEAFVRVLADGVHG